MHLLSQSGWTAAGAVDAVEACALLQSCTPRLVILDAELPLGGEVIARARTTSRTSLIALHADGTFFANTELWDGQLRKPVDEASLREILARLPLSRGTG